MGVLGLIGGGPQELQLDGLDLVEGNKLRVKRWRGSLRTSNATPADLTMSATSRMEANKTYGFEGIVVARGPSGANSAAYRIQGCIKMGANAAAAALVGTPLVTAYEDTAGMDLGVTADTTNGAIKLTATGVSATVIDWTAALHVTELATGVQTIS